MADINVKYSFFSYLHITIACGRKDLVKKLLQLVPHHLLLDTPNDDGQTPLHVAIERNQYLMARWLVIAGASKSPRDVRGESPLHIACRNGDMRCVSALLEPVKHEERQAMKLTCQPPPIHNQMVDLEQWNYAGKFMFYSGSRVIIWLICVCLKWLLIFSRNGGYAFSWINKWEISCCEIFIVFLEAYLAINNRQSR